MGKLNNKAIVFHLECLIYDSDPRFNTPPLSLNMVREHTARLVAGKRSTTKANLVKEFNSYIRNTSLHHTDVYKAIISVLAKR